MLKQQVIDLINESQDGRPIKKFFDEGGEYKFPDQQAALNDPLSVYICQRIYSAFEDNHKDADILNNIYYDLRYGAAQLNNAVAAIKGLYDKANPV